METLKTIAEVLIIASHATLIFFALTSWFRLSSMLRDIRAIKMSQRHTLALLSVMNLQASFNHLREMRSTLDNLVKNEQFKEAQHLKKLIEELEEMIGKNIQEFHETFGDIADLKIERWKP